MSRTTSKFRHVFPTAAKTDGQYRDIRMSNTIWDCSNFIQVNSKYVAVAWAGGGGKLAIINMADTIKIPSDTPCITGHTAPILDWAFHPFAENLIATTSEDCNAKIWSIPEGGLKENLDTPLITLSGHSKKVGICKFHHVAMNTLTTAAMDHTVKMWDIEVGEKGTIDVHKDQIFSLDYNLDGSQFVSTSRDKSIRIVDARANAVVAEGTGHLGNKTQKAVWAKRADKIVTVGFGKMQDRQVYLWDPRKMDEKLQEIDLDTASGVMMTFFDEDTNMLYLGGKGDGNIRYYELTDQLNELSQMGGSVPQRGLAMLPKVACDTTKCEVSRMFRLESDKVVPISFQCPRKQAATEFQTDVYPDTFSTEPTMTAAEYFEGKTAPPNTMPMVHGTGGGASNAVAVELKVDNAKPVSKGEIEAQQAKVEKLRVELAAEEATLSKLEAEFKGM